MLGLGDIWVTAAYFGSIGITLVCIVYGILTWNKSDEEEQN